MINSGEACLGRDSVKPFALIEKVEDFLGIM